MGPLLFLLPLLSFGGNQLVSQVHKLSYKPSPIDNPLKGLVPYAGDVRNKFPHSMEFGYLNLSDLMTGPSTFEWTKLERLLNDVASLGHQTIFRVVVEYPGQPSGVPKYLLSQGLKLIQYPDPDSSDKNAYRETPDYKDPRLQDALVAFIKAAGKKYDGDARIAYITAGLLGCWGEWHTYPRSDLFAPKALQERVLTAFESSFKTTPVLLRYPYSTGDAVYVENRNRKFGYHDDSFAWATLDTGREEDSWFFLTALKKAGQPAMDKWKSFPIGGEVRPEVWTQVFDSRPTEKRMQNFVECVKQTHATWLMDSGVFEKTLSDETLRNAKARVSKMGYDYSVRSATVSGSLIEKVWHVSSISIQCENLGVAPFYADWPMQLGLVNAKNQVVKSWPLTGSLKGILPGQTRTWTHHFESPLVASAGKLVLRVSCPLKGLMFRFANSAQDELGTGWLTVADLTQSGTGRTTR